MFLLVPAHPGSPGQTAVKRSLLLCVCVVAAEQVSKMSCVASTLKIICVHIRKVETGTCVNTWFIKPKPPSTADGCLESVSCSLLEMAPSTLTYAVHLLLR